MIRITVPALPPVEMSPNSRAHFFVKAKVSKQFKNDVFYCARDVITKYRLGLFPLVVVKVELTFIFRDNRRRDVDNMLGRFKPGMDALKAAGVIVDDDARHLQIGSVKIEVDKGRAPLTIIDVTELNDGSY